MRQKDIDRLKEICEKEGFELEIPGEAYFSGKKAFTITKKDPWDGVEYVSDGIKIYKAHKITAYWVYFTSHIDGDEERANRSFLTPSTEAEYVDQLKKEAFEKYGEIKDGDRFKNPNGNIIIVNTKGWGEFDYFKNQDSLCFGGVYIYQSGKWATKLPEKAKVIPDLYYDHLSHSEEHHVFAFEIKNLSDGYSVAEVSNFLAKQLENYLNDNQE